MLIKSLKLQNYRNYQHLHLNFSPNTNLFFGDNGQGKTNILESLFLAGTSKSHRSSKDRDLIHFNSEEAHIEMVVEKAGREHIIDMHLKKNLPKGIAVNKLPLKRASELFGLAYFVFFSPEDLGLIKAGPANRRRFMDLELSQLDSIYLKNLLNYNRVIHQRNALLKNVLNDESLMETLDIWDGQLVDYGSNIIEIRKNFIDQINKIIADIHYNLSGKKEKIVVHYERSVEKEYFLKALKKQREKDVRNKSTSLGPHRDDLVFEVDGIDLRQFGSQGQQRTAALSLKLAQLELGKSLIGETPILLLDDVLSELDHHRQNCLLASLKDIQTMISCTGLDEFVSHSFGIDKKFKVSAGQAQVWKN